MSSLELPDIQCRNRRKARASSDGFCTGYLEGEGSRARLRTPHDSAEFPPCASTAVGVVWNPAKTALSAACLQSSANSTFSRSSLTPTEDLNVNIVASNRPDSIGTRARTSKESVEIFSKELSNSPLLQGVLSTAVAPFAVA